MKIDNKFIADAYKTLDQIIAQGLLPPIGKWIWLEQDKVRLYVFKDYVEFMTSKETLQVEYNVEESV
tara:strand:+ start:62 stop:262 length:201 start_codon:yes stop_codon:yes gene_type:complete